MGTFRSERTNLTISATAKRRIGHAASIEGKTVSAFILSSAPKSAERSVRHLGTAALARFFDAFAERADRRARSCRSWPSTSLRNGQGGASRGTSARRSSCPARPGGPPGMPEVT